MTSTAKSYQPIVISSNCTRAEPSQILLTSPVQETNVGGLAPNVVEDIATSKVIPKVTDTATSSAGPLTRIAISNLPAKVVYPSEPNGHAILPDDATLTGGGACMADVLPRHLWSLPPVDELDSRTGVESRREKKIVKQKKSNLVRADVQAPPIQPDLPFSGSDDLDDFIAPAKPILKPRFLKDSKFVLPDGSYFVDKILPSPVMKLVEHSKYDLKYFVELHHQASAAGSRGQYRWPEYTPNYIGARIPLHHTNFNLDCWRENLIGYDHVELVQFLEFGFPLGLRDLPELVPAKANHGSAYQFYPYLDKFFASGLLKGGVTGPCGASPFSSPMVSPLMTAPKKPASRRAVYDGTFGEHSLNNATPSEYYMGVRCEYSYPKIADFQKLVLKCGCGCYLWKRDLSRYYLQLPLDPTEYKHTCAVWRGLLFFFVALMFGLRHSGLQGQKVSNAVSWIHRNKGLEYLPPNSLECSRVETIRENDPVVHQAIAPNLDPDRPLPYNCVNYSDDLAGCEETLHKADASFKSLGELFKSLGLEESVEKSSKPSTVMTFLGVEFNTQNLTMSVPGEKLQELRSDLQLWVRRTTATKRELQSIIGKLFWVSKMVKHSRSFISRLLQQLRDMQGTQDNRKVPLSSECRKDVIWWSMYLRTFNGVSAIVNDEDSQQPLDLLMLSSFKVYAGDANLWGGGGWYEEEYWSREFPHFLKSSAIPVHLKEFWVLLASCWIWGDAWSGSPVYLFCDNSSVVDSILYQKPRDQDLSSMLREFLYVVCLKKFYPIIRKIDTKSNFLVDHISRRYDHDSAVKTFALAGKPGMRRVTIPDDRFKLSAPW